MADDPVNDCPTCGFPLPGRKAGGANCPRCLLAAGMEDSAIITGATDELTPAPTATETEGSTVGSYTLVEKLGEGGFGIVWRAEQSIPVKREVAVKVIKAGMDTAEVIARFERERQALVVMDHPNIAKVFDAGATESGRPFFAMELVNGVTIDQYGRHELGLRDMLELFVSVCRAVQHAHSKGIIHRDLKPSNVLVTEHDGIPVPKVIDFGIAKAMEDDGMESILKTMAGTAIGTPLYMSPEQVLGDTDIDTRADIYSLGAMLYELLAGVTPVSKADITSVSFTEVQRLICDVEPARPSDRARSADESSHPSRLIRGDLDWVTMKALEKDRDRRYETADVLARELQQYLNGEAVEAGSPTVTYRLRKFAMRNKGPLLTTAAIFMALITGIGVSLWQASVAREEASRAATAETVATRNAARAGRVSDFIKEIFESANPSESGGRDYSVIQLLEDFSSEERWDDLADEPDVEIEIRRIIRDAYFNLGRMAEAEIHLRHELELAEKLGLIADPAVAAGTDRLAKILRLRAHYSESRVMYERALKMRREIHGDDENPEIAESLSGLASVLTHMGRFEESEPMHRDALRIRQSFLESDDPAIADSLIELGTHFIMTDRQDQAMSLIAEAAMKDIDGRNPITKAHLAFSTALLFEKIGNHSRAITSYRAAAAAIQERWGDASPWLGVLDYRIGQVYHSQGMWNEAEDAYRKALTFAEKVAGPEHLIVAEGRTDIAVLLVQRGRPDEAVPFLQKNLGVLEKLPAESFPSMAGRVNEVAFFLTGQPHYPEKIEELLRDSLRVVRKFGRKNSGELALAMSYLGIVLANEGFRNPTTPGKLGEAENLLSEAFDIAFGEKGEGILKNETAVRSITNNFAELLAGTGRFAEADELLAKVDQAILARSPAIVANVVSQGSTWSWLHPTDGRDPDEDDSDFHETFHTLEFDSSTWKQGIDAGGRKGGFGYGRESDDGVNIGTPLPGNRFTAYFRHEFATNQPYEHLEIRFHCNDGAIVYIDGKEVVREGIGKFDTDEFRLSSFGPVTSLISFPVVTCRKIEGPLKAGNHVLAISIHNSSPQSPDLRLANVSLVAVEEDEGLNRSEGIEEAPIMIKASEPMNRERLSEEKKPANSEYFDFTDIFGQRNEARIEKVEGGYVYLRTRNGAELHLPMKNLSAKEQETVKNWLARD